MNSYWCLDFDCKPNDADFCSSRCLISNWPTYIPQQAILFKIIFRFATSEEDWEICLNLATLTHHTIQNHHKRRRMSSFRNPRFVPLFYEIWFPTTKGRKQRGCPEQKSPHDSLHVLFLQEIRCNEPKPQKLLWNQSWWKWHVSRQTCLRSEQSKSWRDTSRIFETILLVDFSSFRIILRDIVYICSWSRAVFVRPQLIEFQ